MCIPGCKSYEPAPTGPPGVCATCEFKPVSVWAAGRGVPGTYLRADARVPAVDVEKGQSGWDVVLPFYNASHLGTELGVTYKLPKSFDEKERQFVENQIQKLAIHAHGGSGGVDIDNAAVSYYDLHWAPNALNIKTLATPLYEELFKQILRVLANDAELYFMCCLTGLGRDGKLFLEAVSNRLASKRVKVIGYSSTLATSTYMLHQDPNYQWASHETYYPGCRETSEDAPNKAGAMQLDGPGWHDFKAHPWASNVSPAAQVALGGATIKEGVDPHPPPPVDPPASTPPPSAPPSSRPKSPLYPNRNNPTHPLPGMPGTGTPK